MKSFPRVDTSARQRGFEIRVFPLLSELPSSITKGNAQIPFKQSVKNFDFTLDNHLTMNAHVSNTAQTIYFELRRLASIR